MILVSYTLPGAKLFVAINYQLSTPPLSFPVYPLPHQHFVISFLAFVSITTLVNIKL